MTLVRWPVRGPSTRQRFNSSESTLTRRKKNMDETNSPYAHILHTNRTPSIAEIDAIKTYLLKPEAKLQRLENEISRMRAILASLESEHAQLKKFVDSHRAILSPIKRIPPELLQEIFVRCLPTRNCVMDATEAPLLLTCICSEWRNIAISTSELWSSLHIVVPDRNWGAATNMLLPVVIQSAKDWFARSGTHPLSVSLFIDQDQQPQADEFCSIIELLDSFLHRLQSIDLNVREEFLLQLGPRSVPLLQYIAIRIDHDSPRSELSLFSIFKETSSLRRITMKGPTSLNDTLSLPFDQLQTLNLECEYEVNQMLDVLTRCRNLQKLSLITRSGADQAMDTDPRKQLITFSHLHTLHLDAQDLMIQTLLRSFVTSELRDIRLQIARETNHQAVYSALSALITRSSCALNVTKLRLSHIQASTDRLIECLSLVPNLIDIELRAFNIVVWSDGRALGNPLLRYLTPTSDSHSTHLLPNLQRITLFNYADLSDETLYDFVRSRRQSASRGIAELSYIYIRRDVD